MSRIQMFDTVVLDAKGTRQTADGYLTAFARVARTGIQVYRGVELGHPEMDMVRVYRPPEEVFSEDALKSFAHRPVTINHPSEMVNASNWRDHAVGQVGAEVVRDGEYVRVPLVLMDSSAVSTVLDTGHRELSMGYFTDLKWGRGATKDGEEYDAVQTAIRGNHLAVVPKARGGSSLRLGDNSPGDSKMAEKTVVVDGVSLTMSDTAAAVVDREMRRLTDSNAKLQSKLDNAKETASKATKDAETAAGAHAAAVAAKDGEIAALKKQVEDSKVTPAVLDSLVKARQETVDAARRVAGSTLAVDGKTVEQIRRDAVTAKLGDSATKMTDAGIEGAFVTLASMAPAAGVPAGGIPRSAMDSAALAASFSTPSPVADARDAAYQAHLKRQADQWKSAGHKTN